MYLYLYAYTVSRWPFLQYSVVSMGNISNLKRRDIGDSTTVITTGKSILTNSLRRVGLDYLVDTIIPLDDCKGGGGWGGDKQECRGK